MKFKLRTKIAWAGRTPNTRAT